METEAKKLSRRDFLRLTGIGIATLSIPRNVFREKEDLVEKWPQLTTEELPEQMDQFKSILDLIPETSIGQDGYLTYDESGEKALSYDADIDGFEPGPDEELRTKFINSPISWVVVLQKPYGNLPGHTEDFSDTAHFLVEEKNVTQTKPPSPEGNPQIAWQIAPINWDEYNPYAAALYAVSQEKEYKGDFDPILSRVFFEEPKISLLRRAIVVKAAGEIGDKVEEESEKLMANLLTVLRSLQRYGLTPFDMVDNVEIYGHNRESRKDIGVKTMAEIRHYLGVLALISGDEEEKELIFGDFMRKGEDRLTAVKRYFKANRDYLMRVIRPVDLQEWDAKTKYWFFMDKLLGKDKMPIADNFAVPVEKDSGGGTSHLEEEWDLYKQGERTGTYHLGHDFNVGFGNEDEGTLFKSIARGIVVFRGWTVNGLGQVVIIRHRLEDGQEVYSRYAHTKDLFIKVGDEVQMGEEIGTIGRTGHEDNPNFYAHLHLDIAYSATYEQTMQDAPHYYPNESKENAARLFMDPIAFIEEHKKREVNEELANPLKFRQVME